MENKISSKILLDMYRKMKEIRHFEDTVYFMFLEGILPGTVHLYQGQEAIAAGVCANLTREDVILSTHRPDGHAIAKGVSLRSCMAEFFGKATGCCKGKGGAMHLGDIEVGMPPAIAIVAGGVPLACGAGLAFKFQKKKNVAVTFFGDGATNEGVWHESMNMASLWDLPVIFVCENNLYGASTHITRVMKIPDIAKRADAYGIPGLAVDGNNVIEVYKTTRNAVEKAKAGDGPTLIECKTYRRSGHSRGDANQYRDKDEEKEWLARDPIIIAQNRLKDLGILTEEKIKKIDEEVKAEIEEAVQFAKNSPFPAIEDAGEDLWAE
ncbi:MAG: thiamine pyrophosphate-dependent dehydrogenase E1 component subunit alpha [Candidatus Omnitrophota bacterium]